MRKSLSVAAAATCAVAFLYADDLAGSFAADYSRIFQWAGITVVLIANPLLGGLAKTSLDRCLGSFMGALIAMIGAYISTHGAFYVPFTAISIYGFHMAGQMLDAGYSSKIAMLSFILVAGSCLRDSQAYWRIALVRLTGIVLGVILAQLASVLIYSETHSDAAIARLQKSLQSTAELCEAAWLAWHLTDKPHVPTFLTAPAEELQAALKQAAQVKPVLPAAVFTASPQSVPPFHREATPTGAKSPASPVGGGVAQVAAIPGSPTRESAMLTPEAPPQSPLPAARGKGGGEAILGILQIEDRSVLPVTPNLLSQIARLHASVTPMSSRRESCPAPASILPSHDNSIYQTTSAPDLMCSPLPAHAEDPAGEGDIKTGTGADVQTRPPVLHQHGFGSMQDLVRLSRSTSVDTPASTGHVRAPSQMSPLAPAPAVSMSPLHHTATEASGSAAVPAAEPVGTGLPTSSSDAVAAAEHRVLDGPEAVSDTAVHIQLPEAAPVAHSDDATGDGDISPRTWTQQPAAVPDQRAADPAVEDVLTWTPAPSPAPLPPPKVASVAAWLDSMPTWPQLSRASMQQAHLAQSGPGSAAGGDQALETQVAMPSAQDAGLADRQGTMYQAWRRLLGQHSDTSQAAHSVSAQPGVPSVHQLNGASAFASATVPLNTSASGSQPSTPQPCPGTTPPARGSQHGTYNASRRLSSTGLSTQAASPHRTRITSDTAKSHRSLESVPASEIQWLLQAMGSALEPADSLPAVTPNGTQAAVNNTASPVTPVNGKEGSGRPGTNGVSSHIGSRSQDGTGPASPGSAAANSGHRDASAPSKGLQVAVDDVLGWDLDQQEVSDRRCEDLLMTILQQSSKVDADVEGTMGEVLVRFWKIQKFLPRPVSSVQKLRRNHMPKAAIENLVHSIRVAARILWALHMTLREGFTRDMVVLLKDTYPAALLSDLRHFSIAALYDVVGAFPESFVATVPPNVPQENLRRFISTVEALVTISRNHAADNVENLFLGVPPQATPSKGFSMPSLPSLQTSPLQAMVPPAAGPVAESTINAGESRKTRTDGNELGHGEPASTPPRPPNVSALRTSNDSRGSTVNAALPLNHRAGAPDTGAIGFDGEGEGGAPSTAVRKRGARLPFAAVFGSINGRSTLDGSLHRRASKVSRLSWETARQHDSGGPRWTRALMFPSTVEGFLARVRWQAFQQNVTQLAEQMMRLQQTVKNVLLHLPGPEGVSDPTVVPDSDFW